MVSVLALLAFALCAEAQDKTPDASQPNASADAQASPSDEVLVPGDVESVAPVAPLEQDSSTPLAATGTNDCLGCGQITTVVQGCSDCGITVSRVSGCATPCCSARVCQPATCCKKTRTKRRSAACCVRLCEPACCDCAHSPVSSCISMPTAACGCNSVISQVSYAQPVVENVQSTCGSVLPVCVANCQPCNSARSGRRGRLLGKR